MATTTTTWITTDSISHKHRDFDSKKGSYLTKNGSLQPLPLTEEREIRRKEVYTETAEIKSSDTEQNAVIPVLVDNQLATTQNALLLHAIKEKYTLVTDHAVPSILHQDEILIEVSAIGLNPIDWKAPYVLYFPPVHSRSDRKLTNQYSAFNFGIPSLPWVFGRDLAGTVIKTSSSSSRLQTGDLVLVPSTDYRDIRKAAFQEYAVTTHYNAAKIPPTTSIHGGASIGVAYVAAALALGVSFGLDFGLAHSVPGPDLRTILKGVDAQDIPEDVRPECLPSSEAEAERVQKGDWIAIWGGEQILLTLVKCIELTEYSVYNNRLHSLTNRKALRAESYMHSRYRSTWTKTSCSRRRYLSRSTRHRSCRGHNSRRHKRPITICHRHCRT